jgi:uncharacterized protein (DUF488 family)
MAGSILTIGYGNRSLEEVVASLRSESVQYLIDVRSNPISGFKPEFSAEPLERALRTAGIRYVFMGDSLGGRPADASCYEGGHVIYQRVQEKAFFKEGIRRLVNALGQSLSVCLLCSEGRPSNCHRSKLIGVALDALGVEVVHLDQGGRRLSQAEVVKALESSQGDLFGLQLRSRKSYNSRTAAPRHHASYDAGKKRR